MSSPGLPSGERYMVNSRSYRKMLTNGLGIIITETHQRKRCQGRTPMETFFNGLKLVKEKNLDNNFEGVSDTCQM